ncbi:hypothetical protein ACEN32_01655 [Marinilactibacillus psychrotolerans]|uniref:hypothetical protein n=1 Tax=Marinilactibacillus psychrotolerans TaxID=191770 RepID=UPI003884A6C0
MDTIFMLIFFILFVSAIYKMINQIRTIIIRQQVTSLMKCLQPLIVLIFLAISWFGSAPFLGYILSLTAAVMLILSLYNKGFTKDGIIPNMPGAYLNSLLSRKFTFEETSDWLMIEKKSKIKVRFTNDQYQSVYYIDFPLADKEKIIQFAAQHNQIVDVEHYK